MTKKNTSNFSQEILTWYDQFGRKNLPWRQEISPYRIWLSEIMLQQTQVTTVLPYFAKFIERFPRVQDLAMAHEDEVLRFWAGLGYYSRARNLHKTAKLIANHLQEEFPDTVAELEKLPGIGRSTAGAIAAIAFKKAAPILDGNVKRVLTRIAAIAGWPGETKVTEQLWLLAEKLLPEKRCDDYTQAMMDLGATICTRTQPKCDICPVKQYCLAHQQNKQTEFPTPKTKKIIPTKFITMLLIFNDQQQILLEKRPAIGIWGGLWSLPECEVTLDPTQWCYDQYGLKIKETLTLSKIKHTFSHFHLIITPIRFDCLKQSNKIMQPKPIEWHALDQSHLGLAAPVKKLLATLNKEFA